MFGEKADPDDIKNTWQSGVRSYPSWQVVRDLAKAWDVYLSKQEHVQM